MSRFPYYNQLLDADHYDFGIGFKEDPFFQNNTQMLPIIRPIYHPYQPSIVGFVYAELSVSMFTETVSEYARLEDTCVYFTSGGRSYAITPEQTTPSNDLEDLEACHADIPLNQNITLQRPHSGSNRYYLTIPLNVENCSLTLPISNDAFKEQANGYLGILITIFLLGAVICIVLICSLSHIVARPVRSIRARLTAISGGDFSQDASIEWDNEFGDIGKTVNQLAVDIHNLIDAKVAYEKQKKDYEYQVLQSQINPHFLYNTLNSIKWMATTQSATGIAEMATALSHLLKNLSKGTSTVVSIQDEITFPV